MEQYFKSLYSDSWNILEVLTSDSSPIDLSRLPIDSREDAYGFVRSYGFELDKPEEAAEVEKIRLEALRFIQRQLIDTLGPEYHPLEIPAEIFAASVLDLLLTASGNPRARLQKWACAVLRVMHTLSHVVTDLALHFFPSIQDQILAPYYRHIRPDNHQMWLGEDPDFRLPLVDFQVKAGKDRDSALLKLLHKPENVAADIFDRIGVRFVTRDRFDALLVLHYLREKHLVAFPNVKPSRSSNTLIEIDAFRKLFRRLYQRYRAGELELAEFEAELRLSAQLGDTLSPRQLRRLFGRNPHSSSQYRSIQFTVRQLVRLVNPLYTFMGHIEQALEAMDEDQRANPLMREPLEHARAYYRFFFPYEIQIVDQATHLNNMSGLASHNVYKQRQVEVARKRVLGKLVRRRSLDEIKANSAALASVVVEAAGPIPERQKVYQWLLEETETVP
ncbi:MAG: hypothetical protein CVV27_09955 [Candidatus Melainabacteria bacterium HGW-Melainabacteria-1]|nr:MAG: hypothetical protein CVV27_09955 [Candidatus Melainabacteria bacterium HGW-Melainabacteria-1]